ncbi:hypothetical protein GAU_1805 [Gemmatimonas aurantiaca T-27]|uniref:Uncharacterized protein n=1 Tax=Gemmatimonas aurantiaca (strain DSM 14586 / JCM 11422 / NBRC 100505 / T-27) TaxID=379066 RepID=C1A422_GEMAT|nr:hypothetical protein [Gemmatimonas aurantiaca]BAH38847.1 hypothetical protein GAU_1805 [Gemmatimonas aurantiaca T-27]
MTHNETTPPAAAEEPSAIAVLREADGMNLYASIDRGDGGEESTGYLCAVTDIVSLYDTLAARVAELEAERDRYKRRGDQHWETLRSIRHIAQTSGDLKRIAQWVTEAGTGYVDTVEATLAQMTDRALAAEQRVAAVERTITALRELDQPVFVAASKAAFEASTGKDASTANMDEVDQYVEVAAAVITAALAAAAPAATQQTNGDQSNG